MPRTRWCVALISAQRHVREAKRSDARSQGAPDAAPGAPLALGVGASVYFLRQKGLPLPRAAGLAALGLLAGTVVGTAAQGTFARFCGAFCAPGCANDAFSPATH